MTNLKNNFLHIFKNNLPIVVLVVLCSAFFWKYFVKDLIPLPGDFIAGIYYPWLDYEWGFPNGVPVKNPITADVVSFIYPMQTYAIELMKSGQLPLWNPYILTGAPLLANFQSAPFSPTNWLYWILPTLDAWSIQIILQHILVSIFTYILLRHWKISKWAAIGGGMIFAFSGYNMIWSQWNGHALAAAFIPLIIYFEDRLLKEKSPIYGVGLAISLCLQIFSGYPQTVMYTVLAMGILWLVHIKLNREYLIKTIWLTLFSILGLALAGIQILPGAELLSLSQRESEPFPYESAFLPWEKAITFFAPDYFGNHATYNYWGSYDYTNTVGFVGSLALFLITFSRRKSKEFWFSAAVFIFTLILSFPTPLSVFIWKEGLFGLQAAAAHRALVLNNFSVALLAAFSLDKLVKRKQISIKIPYALGFSLFFLLWIMTVYLLKTTEGDPDYLIWTGISQYMVAVRNLMFPTLTFMAGVILIILYKLKLFRNLIVPLFIVLITFELFRFGWKYTPFSPKNLAFPTTPELQYLGSQEEPFRVTGSAVIPINIKMPYKLETPEGYDAVYPLRIATFMAVIDTGNFEAGPQGRFAPVHQVTSELLDVINTQYYLTTKKNEIAVPAPDGKISEIFDTKRFSPVYDEKATVILESQTTFPRAYMVYDWEVLQNPREILRNMVDDPYALRTKVYLEEEPNLQKAESAENNVEYQTYEDQKSVLSVRTEAPGILFISDAWYPGWKAYVDGNEVPIMIANYTFRAVKVPEGEHLVTFEYKPESFTKGLQVSGIAAMALLGSFLFLRYTYHR